MKLHFFNWLALIFSMVFLFACKSTRNVTEKTEIYQYALHVGPCFGYCPVFDVYVYRDGKAVWDARRFNKTNGKFERQLSEEELKVLMNAFKKADLFKMQDEYPTMVADLPSITLTENKKGKVKTVKGNENMPEAYEYCVDLMRQITQTGSWKQIESYPADDPPRQAKMEETTLYHEIIIEPNAGISLPRWFKENSTYGIYLIRKVSPDLNLWVIGYDRNQIEPRMMLEILKKDPAIKTAEFNKKTEERN